MLGSRRCTNRKRVDVRRHHVAQHRVDRAVPRQRRESREAVADDVDDEMPAPVARAGVADVPMTVVDDLDRRRRECGFQQAAHAHDSLGIRGRNAHGNTRRNGRTSTRWYTPAATYGSSAAHARASASEGNSAMTMLPLK